MMQYLLCNFHYFFCINCIAFEIKHKFKDIYLAFLPAMDMCNLWTLENERDFLFQKTSARYDKLG